MAAFRRCMAAVVTALAFQLCSITVIWSASVVGILPAYVPADRWVRPAVIAGLVGWCFGFLREPAQRPLAAAGIAYGTAVAYGSAVSLTLPTEYRLPWPIVTLIPVLGLALRFIVPGRSAPALADRHQSMSRAQRRQAKRQSSKARRLTP